MSGEDKNAHIGEIKIGSGDDHLHCLLGSCVGVAFLWKKKDLYGLAHCLLPYPPKETDSLSSRFVNQAVLLLIEKMGIGLSDYRNIEVILAGGANMTKPLDTPNEKLVGFMNSEQATASIKKLKLRVIHTDFGGHFGRKITINCSDSSFNIKILPREIAA